MLKNFRQRSTEAELMDSETVSFAEFHECLQHLKKINICTLAYRPTMRWLKQAIIRMPDKQTITIWDIGSGGGDMLNEIWRYAKPRGIAVHLVGIDINPQAAQSAKLMAPNAPIQLATSDIFTFAPEQQADFIISSLFTHHLNDLQLAGFINWMEQHAKHGWFINDLHRHFIPYYFIKYVVRWLRLNRLVIHDAPISVARGFTKTDLRRLLSQAKVAIKQTNIRWFFPFRYGVTRWK